MRAATAGQPPEIKTYRRRSPVKLVNALRETVKEWRDFGYPGASDTTQQLLSYWFERPHRLADGNGGEIAFRYYFCQREAIETFIVPLRPLTAQSSILPEQTLGRGLRRMTAPGQANELVTVVEHPSFINLYEQELEQEGLPNTIEEVEKVPATTVTIFADESKDFDKLDIALPALTAAHEIQPKLEGLTIEEVRSAFKAYTALPLGKATVAGIEYEGRALITDELVESMKINLPLLQNGLTAISFFVRELEAACRVQSTHTVPAPLLQTFLGEILFGENVSLVDARLTARLSDQDVREHIRTVFIPLIRKRTVKTEKRRTKGSPQSLRHWKPYQATYSESRPVEKAARTLFNLVPCNRSLEVATARFLDKAPDVAAFAKNAGPQAVRIDYLTADHRLAFYTPDFFVRGDDGAYYPIETKGRQDRDVPRKANAGVEWCKTASKSGVRWQYVFVPQIIMEGLTSSRLDDLVRACAPALQKLLDRLAAVNDFRNSYVAHHEKELNDKALAERNLKHWVETLGLLRV